MKNQDLLLLAGAAVVGLVLYKKYTTSINPFNTVGIPPPVPNAPVTNAPAQIQQPAYSPPSPITAVMPTGAMALTFDNIQNF